MIRTGQVEELLKLLSEGTRPVDVLTRRLRASFPNVTADEVAELCRRPGLAADAGKNGDA